MKMGFREEVVFSNTLGTDLLDIDLNIRRVLEKKKKKKKSGNGRAN